MKMDSGFRRNDGYGRVSQAGTRGEGMDSRLRGNGEGVGEVVGDAQQVVPVGAAGDHEPPLRRLLWEWGYPHLNPLPGRERREEGDPAQPGPAMGPCFRRGDEEKRCRRLGVA